jgi:cytoplasmic tRNA 2-thiolation protein 2
MDLPVTPCRRCQQPSIVVIRRVPLCQDCFTSYIGAKLGKRLAEYAKSDFVSTGSRSYLLPISFGSSSLSMLVAFDRYKEFQKQKNGKSRLSLHVVHLQEPGQSSHEKLDQLRQLFPEYTFSSHHISSFFDPDMKLSQLDTDAKLSQLLNTLKSNTAKDDILRICLVRSVVQFAKKGKFKNILWGDTTTRLAERVLSETSKGRGFSLPWQISDGETPFGVHFMYPFRDVLRTELTEYINLTDPSIKALIDAEKSVVPVNLRNTSIDLLMSRYFESAEEQYPNIVSNVVRTGTKLILGPVGLQRCKLCTYPMTNEQRGELMIETHKDLKSTTNPEPQHNICYACARNATSSTIALLP